MLKEIDGKLVAVGREKQLLEVVNSKEWTLDRAEEDGRMVFSKPFPDGKGRSIFVFKFPYKD